MRVLFERIGRGIRSGVAACAAVLALPGVSAACSMCISGGRQDNELAFVGTTALLSLLPLGMIGGVVCWLVVRAHAISLADDATETRAEQPARIIPAAEN